MKTTKKFVRIIDKKLANHVVRVALADDGLVADVAVGSYAVVGKIYDSEPEKGDKSEPVYFASTERGYDETGAKLIATLWVPEISGMDNGDQADCVVSHPGDIIDSHLGEVSVEPKEEVFEVPVDDAVEYATHVLDTADEVEDQLEMIRRYFPTAKLV